MRNASSEQFSLQPVAFQLKIVILSDLRLLIICHDGRIGMLLPKGADSELFDICERATCLVFYRAIMWALWCLIMSAELVSAMYRFASKRECVFQQTGPESLLECVPTCATLLELLLEMPRTTDERNSQTDLPAGLLDHMHYEQQHNRHICCRDCLRTCVSHTGGTSVRRRACSSS